MPISQINLANEQVIQMPVQGPDEANQLFIFTGTANFQLKGKGQKWHREVLSFELGRIFSKSQYRKGIGTASLAIISNENKSVNAGWAIERVRVGRSAKTGKPKLTARLALRDSDGHLSGIAYEVYVLAKI